VRDAGIVPGDTVLEVGPGPGLLTRHLLAAGARVRAVEIDPGMQRVAAELVEEPLGDRLTWVEADAMGGGRRLSPDLLKLLPGCCSLVANLPYGVAAPLTGSLVVEPTAPDHWVVMIQKEMADRMVADTGGRDYGPLAVLMRLTAEVKVLRKVPPQAFWPRPKVDSVVVRVDRRSHRPSPEELAALQAFLAAAFHARRKMLVNSLSEAWQETPGSILSSIKLESSQKKWRAEAFDPVQLCELARHWAQSALGERYRPWVGPSRRPH